MQHHQKSVVPLSVRVLPKIRDKLEELADITGRTKSFLAAEAIEFYLNAQAWQIKGIEKALKKANSKKAKFTEHEKVVDWLNSWGTEKEEEFFVRPCNGLKIFKKSRMGFFN